ncbi:hypothetical protein GCM10011380_00480 [Sphingomonas metalli]|uniref:DUF5681 domain-containing protein n=1 Tax=Sphingomonas metalli TaxID=1779358 RepID=A0A916SV54_9SPHN|nr:hypothetical protein [Sphingomonas metalli]GGB14975.1 hypothetical protein GCM10011380_00480 [Sphingomonas metalli]
MTSTKKVGDSAHKPPAAGKGRPKGATNKLTRTIKQAIEQAFDQVGGPEYLATMAIQQPAAFMTLLGKVLPTQVEHSNPDGTLKQPTVVRIVAADDRSDDQASA